MLKVGPKEKGKFCQILLYHHILVSQGFDIVIFCNIQHLEMNFGNFCEKMKVTS